MKIPSGLLVLTCLCSLSVVTAFPTVVAAHGLLPRLSEKQVLQAAESIIIAKYTGTSETVVVEGESSDEAGKVVKVKFAVTRYLYEVVRTIDGVQVPSRVVLAVRGGVSAGVSTAFLFAAPTAEGSFVLAVTRDPVPGRDGYILVGGQQLNVKTEDAVALDAYVREARKVATPVKPNANGDIPARAP